MICRVLVLLATLALLLLPRIQGRAEPPAPRYALVDLGEAGSRYDTGVFALNDTGQVVGGNGEAFLWEAGKRTGLGALPKDPFDDVNGSVAYSINNRGQIVGYSGGGSSISMSGLFTATAFLYEYGKMTALAGRVNGASFVAYDINDKGQIAGLDGYRGFFYDNGKLITLSTLSKVPEGNRGEAHALNNHGQVVGWSTADKGPHDPHFFLPVHAFLWQRGKSRMRDLGTLPSCRDSRAYSINDKGQVVGEAAGLESPPHKQAFLWSRAKMHALGYLPGGKNNSAARSINNSGQIVGASGDHAAFWEGNRVYDLNTLVPSDSGWTLKEARAINNQGQIVGIGEFRGPPGPQTHAFLLTPLPLSTARR